MRRCDRRAVIQITCQTDRVSLPSSFGFSSGVENAREIAGNWRDDSCWALEVAWSAPTASMRTARQQERPFAGASQPGKCFSQFTRPSVSLLASSIVLYIRFARARYIKSWCWWRLKQPVDITPLGGCLVGECSSSVSEDLYAETPGSMDRWKCAHAEGESEVDWYTGHVVRGDEWTHRARARESRELATGRVTPAARHSAPHCAWFAGPRATASWNYKRAGQSESQLIRESAPVRLSRYAQNLFDFSSLLGGTLFQGSAAASLISKLSASTS